jgi:hypothetical protein
LLFLVLLSQLLSLAAIGHSRKDVGSEQPLPSVAQRSDRSRKASDEVDLKIETVGLGSHYRSVRRRLGVPGRQLREFNPDTTCGPPYTNLKLSYPGLETELDRWVGRGKFTVVSMEVVSAHWLISPGIRVGMNERMIRKKLGATSSESDANGSLRLYYTNKGNDGSAVFYFRGGVLEKVAWASDLC